MCEPSLFQFLFAILIWNTACYEQECDLNGINCISCTDYQECNGGAPLGPIFSCKNGVDCREESLMEYCRIKLNCYAMNECTEVGIFPDKTTESKYYVCLPNSGSGFIKYDFICPEGEFFDKTSQMCLSYAITLETTIETTATFSTPASTTKSATTAPSSAPSSSSTPETTSPTSTSVNFTDSIATTPTLIPTRPSFFICTAPGIFLNPTNCKMYFRCSTSLKLYNYSCPGTSYFNENLLKCSLIITPTCQEEILKNITTSTTSLTSSITATSISTPPPTTAPSYIITTTMPPSPQPSTTTTSEARSTPFSCSAAGTFENPLDCKTYYRCSLNGRIFLYVCPAGSYYNEFTKRCGLTITQRCRSKLKD